MKFSLTIFACNLVALTSLIVLVSTADAQSAQMPANTQQTAQNGTVQVPAAQAKARTVLLNFRVPEWRTLHSSSAEEAQQTAQTLKSIGCEVKQEQHNDHIDVRFRCVDWKPLKIETDQQLTDWQTWLGEKGIDSVVLNPPAKTSLSTVSYRLAKPRTAHIHDVAQARALDETFQLLGCEVKTADHNGHIDISVNCSTWTTIGVTTDKSAHVWKDWLEQNGFETTHTCKNAAKQNSK